MQSKPKWRVNIDQFLFLKIFSVVTSHYFVGHRHPLFQTSDEFLRQREGTIAFMLFSGFRVNDPEESSLTIPGLW